MSMYQLIIYLSIIYAFVYLRTWIFLQDGLTKPQMDIPSSATSRYHLDLSRVTRHSNSTRLILLWTDFFGDHTWEVEEGRETFDRLQCPVRDCYLTVDRNVIGQSSAVLFHVPNIMDQDPPGPRHPDQRWVYVVLESPIALYDAGHVVRPWRGQFNWTMSYRLDSDIVLPYGEARKLSKPLPRPDYHTIAKSKTKLVAWMVSHCNTHSRREDYVYQLQKYIPVDIYGECGDSFCPRDYGGKDSGCQSMINKTYLFYLAFENANCTDYITEKLFKILPLDVVPIVRGSAEMYRRQVPHKWYINTEDFTSPRELAGYLLHLQKNLDKYVQYFEGKEKYEFTFHMGLNKVSSWCDLCRKLHDPSELPSVYQDVTQWWGVHDCTNPTDLPLAIIPIVIGISVALIVLAAIITVSCFFCRCCPGYKKRQKRLQKAEQQQQQSHDLPDIAVQASGHPLPLDRDPSPVPSPGIMRPLPYLQHQPTCTASPSSHSHSEVLGCGCQWSPTLQHSPMADLDNIMKKLYGDMEEMELETVPEYSVEKPPPYTKHDIHKFELSKFEVKTLGRRFRENKEKASSTEPPKQVTRATSDPSQLCMKTFRPALNVSHRHDADKRDSGVLVEEAEGITEPGADADIPFVMPTFHPQPVLRSPGFMGGYSSSQSSLEVDTSDIKAAIHSHPDGQFYS